MSISDQTEANYLFFALASRLRRKDVHYASIDAGNAFPIFTIVLELLCVQFWPFLTLISTYWPHTVPAASTCFSLTRSPEKIKPRRRDIGYSVCFLPSKPPTKAVYMMSGEKQDVVECLSDL